MSSALSVHHRRPDPDDLDLLSHLVPDLQTAIRVQRLLLDLRTRAERAERALDALPTAVLVLDAHATVVHANDAAASLLGAHAGLSARDDRLCAEQDADSARLRAAVANASHAALRGDDVPPIALAIERSSSPRPLRLTVKALRHADEGDLDPARIAAQAPLVVVTVEDRAPAAPLDGVALRRRFDLTPAQTRLATALASGESLEDYARRAGLSVNTARSTLKSVFAKTGCRRQAELVLVLTGSIAAPDARRVALAPGATHT